MVKNEIYDFIHQINNRKYQVYKPETPANKNDSGLPGTDVVFDQFNKFLIVYGSIRFLIINIEKNTGENFMINRFIYKEIIDINFKSSSDTEYQCYVACRNKYLKQVAIFDFFEYHKIITDPYNKKNANDIDE